MSRSATDETDYAGRTQGACVRHAHGSLLRGGAVTASAVSFSCPLPPAQFDSRPYNHNTRVAKHDPPTPVSVEIEQAVQQPCRLLVSPRPSPCMPSFRPLLASEEGFRPGFDLQRRRLLGPGLLSLVTYTPGLKEPSHCSVCSTHASSPHATLPASQSLASTLRPLRPPSDARYSPFPTPTLTRPHLLSHIIFTPPPAVPSITPIESSTAVPSSSSTPAAPSSSSTPVAPSSSAAESSAAVSSAAQSSSAAVSSGAIASSSAAAASSAAASSAAAASSSAQVSSVSSVAASASSAIPSSSTLVSTLPNGSVISSLVGRSSSIVCVYRPSS